MRNKLQRTIWLFRVSGKNTAFFKSQEGAREQFEFEKQQPGAVRLDRVKVRMPTNGYELAQVLGAPATMIQDTEPVEWWEPLKEKPDGQ